jgi:hypothetical protein
MKNNFNFKFYVSNKIAYSGIKRSIYTDNIFKYFKRLTKLITET